MHHRCGPRPQFLLMSFSISGAVQQGAGWPPHATPEAKNRKVLAGQQAQTLLPEGFQATLLHPSSEVKLQRPEQPSYLDGSQHHTSPVHKS